MYLQWRHWRKLECFSAKKSLRKAWQHLQGWLKIKIGHQCVYDWTVCVYQLKPHIVVFSAFLTVIGTLTLPQPFGSDSMLSNVAMCRSWIWIHYPVDNVQSDEQHLQIHRNKFCTSKWTLSPFIWNDLLGKGSCRCRYLPNSPTSICVWFLIFFYFPHLIWTTEEKSVISASRNLF